jgi:hypothetical protein
MPRGKKPPTICISRVNFVLKPTFHFIWYDFMVFKWITRKEEKEKLFIV